MNTSFYNPECTHIKDNLWVACGAGYTIHQSLNYNFPVLTIRVGQHLFYDGAICDAFTWGNSVQLYEDANAVAGLGELFADRREAEVPALRA